MKKKEILALVSLLDDDDPEVFSHVESKLFDLGEQAVPYLEKKWESTLNLEFQSRIEDIIHSIQFQTLQDTLNRWREKNSDDLLELLWIVATYQYPDYSLEDLKKEIDQLYFGVWSQFKDDLAPMDQVKMLNHILFTQKKFSANTKNFHSPANSMINRVLETKKGNPLSLGSIYLLVAQKLKLPIFGVNLPNLFVLTYKQKDFQFYINAFNKGIIFTKDEIDQYLQQLNIDPQKRFYEPCDNLDIGRRIFRNLLVAFKKAGETEKVAEIELLLSKLL
jgi:regulator of sirC expression with transglutaminase-like and TPR domain